MMETGNNCHCRQCGHSFAYSDGYEYAIDAIVCPRCHITQFRTSSEDYIDSPETQVSDTIQ